MTLFEVYSFVREWAQEIWSFGCVVGLLTVASNWRRTHHARKALDAQLGTPPGIVRGTLKEFEALALWVAGVLISLLGIGVWSYFFPNPPLPSGLPTTFMLYGLATLAVLCAIPYVLTLVVRKAFHIYQGDGVRG